MPVFFMCIVKSKALRGMMLLKQKRWDRRGLRGKGSKERGEWRQVQRVRLESQVLRQNRTEQNQIISRRRLSVTGQNTTGETRLRLRINDYEFCNGTRRLGLGVVY